MAIKIIGFDADDTLWVNEPHYQNTEKYFLDLLKGYATREEISSALFKTEIENLELYGYGAKGFILSMTETAIRISNRKVTAEEISKIIEMGKSLMDMPIEILEGVEQVLSQLKNRYKLIVVTKGDLLDQERKLRKSGLAHYFDHIEIVSDKKEKDYKTLISHLGIETKEFMMIGNSMKSDIFPVLDIGGYAIHVPYHTTWAHENAEVSPGERIQFKSVSKLSDVLKIL
jgi:putative hydrolase of the HAD superfamily